MKRKGSSLVTTLSLTAVLAGAGVFVAQASVQHLQLAVVGSARSQSLSLARSAASLALAKLSDDPKFGTTGRAPLIKVDGQSQDSQGLVCFQADQGEPYGLAASLNNLEGTKSVEDSLGRPVPKGCLRLYAVGLCRGQRQRIEVEVGLPGFEAAVAAQGRVRAVGGFEMGGLPAIPSDSSNIDRLPRTDSNLISNDDGKEAIFLGAGTRILGSVQAAGGVEIDPNSPADSVFVKGSIRPHASKEELPRADFAKYDPRQAQGSFTTIDVPQLGQGANLLGGRLLRRGNLEFTHGLELDGSLLFVEGNLKVQGGIRGKGIVVATEGLEVYGQNDLRGSDGVALLAGGDTLLRGSGADGSFFLGQIYTQGKFLADRVTIVGGLISNNEVRRETVELRDSRVFTTPRSDITIQLKPSQPPAAQPPPTTSPPAGVALPPFRTQVRRMGRATGSLTFTFSMKKLPGDALEIQLVQGAGGPAGVPQIFTFQPFYVGANDGRIQALTAFLRNSMLRPQFDSATTMSLLNDVSNYYQANAQSLDPPSDPNGAPPSPRARVTTPPLMPRILSLPMTPANS